MYVSFKEEKNEEINERRTDKNVLLIVSVKLLIDKILFRPIKTVKMHHFCVSKWINFKYLKFN